MFSGLNYNKLKTNLRLATNRLKLLGKKKTELTQKSRKEIADFIAGQKEDRARIRVEQIVREDYFVEAFELLEMFCDLLLARFGLIEQMKEMDKGLEEAVNSILWAAARIQAEVPELKIIAEQLTLKYGKPYTDGCRENKFDKINEKLLHKLSVQTPPKVLVEKYMVEIAKSHNVPFVPDANVVMSEEAANAEALLIDYQNKGQPQQGYGWAVGPAMNNEIGSNSGGGGGGKGSPQPMNYPSPQTPTAPPGIGRNNNDHVTPASNAGAALTPTSGGVHHNHGPGPQQGPICMHGGHPHPFVEAQTATPGGQHQQPPFNYPNVQKDLEYCDEYKVPLDDNHSGSAGLGGLPAPPPYTTLPPFDHLSSSSQGGQQQNDPRLPGGHQHQNPDVRNAPNPPPDDDGEDADELNFDDLNRRFEELKKKR